jgi:NNP family nitrate/nitrite transporter-like MFS transporter
MGIAGAGNSGTVIAMLAAPPLAFAFGWRTVYLLGLIPMAIALVLLQAFAKEPPDREDKKLRDYLKVLVSGDAWVFNLVYSVTFGGFIGLASFLPTLFHDHYNIPKQSVGIYVTLGVIAASGLRVVGGWLADRIGGIRLLYILCGLILLGTAAAASMPASAWTMAILVALAMGAMGAGNGAVFQLVPLRFSAETAVAGSLIGEIGALAGGFLPNAMGLGKQYFASFTPGFIAGAVLTAISILLLVLIAPKWTKTWVREGGKAHA